MPSGHEIAKYFLVGFQRAWFLKDVLAAVGLSYEDAEEVSKTAPFMPANPWQYSAPVRAVVAAEWPKLNAWLIANADDPAKLARVADQLLRLKFKGEKRHQIASTEDRALMRRTRGQSDATQASYGMSRDAFKRRSAWDVCKA